MTTDQRVREALRRLLTPPPGSAMGLGQHDHGKHYLAACEAWDEAEAALAAADAEQGKPADNG